MKLLGILVILSALINFIVMTAASQITEDVTGYVMLGVGILTSACALELGLQFLRFPQINNSKEKIK